MESTGHPAPILAIVVPCCNEGPVIAETSRRLLEVRKDLVGRSVIHPASFLCFVDDGSEDDTWPQIVAAKERSPSVSGVRLSRNYGHQYALLAGLSRVRERCDCAISLDADLQDDVAVIERFVAEYQAGNEIVYGVRRSRKPDRLTVRLNAALFYRLMRLLGAPTIDQHADFRLTGRKVMAALEDHREATVFLRGLFPSMGFRHAVVRYDRQARQAGRSKYTLPKMLAFALDGILSSSTVPLRLVSAAGLFVFLAGGVLFGGAVIVKLAGGKIEGWTVTALAVCFLGGVQLLSLGLIGEYVGRIFWESKRRPRYIIDEEI